MSTRMRMSSATASDGWVSLSWIATLSGSLCQSAFARRKRRDQIRQRASDEEVLLQQPQRAATQRGIVGIQHARQRFSHRAFRSAPRRNRRR